MIVCENAARYAFLRVSRPQRPQVTVTFPAPRGSLRQERQPGPRKYQ